MHNTKNGYNRLLSMSRVAHKLDTEDMNTVKISSQQSGDRRAFDILMEAQHYWNQMEDFRKDRERN